MVSKNICSCCKGRGSIELFTSIVDCDECEGKGFVLVKEYDDDDYYLSSFYRRSIGFEDED